MKIYKFHLLISMIFALTACVPLVGKINVEIETPIPQSENTPTLPPTPTETELPRPTETPRPTQPPTNVILTPEAGGYPPNPLNFDAIQITEPGPGSRLAAPIHITGNADPTFEQTLVIRIVLDDGTELNRATTNILTDAGNRGPFSIDMDFAVLGERQAFIQVFSVSPRDGGITHLNSVLVTLADSGPVDIRQAMISNEPIVVANPLPGGIVSGGVAHIEGYAAPSFENHLFIEIVDVNGNVVGSAPVIVDAPDFGVPGPFTIDIPYTITEAQAGRIVIHDPSVVIEGDVHLVSVEVQFEP
ncbi:MAG: hypothetical protein H6636_08650 [Anaerolineales bacterium]|nr:hypothetical protein [Anaerolineales bacterium]